MIFRTQKLEELKNIEYQSMNLEIKTLKQKIFNEVWPQIDSQHFCEAIESIALKWLNQFVTLIEKWLTQTSSKYINKLSFSSQIKRSQDKQQLQHYLLNFSKYIQSMQHPLITSINNIQSLYLKYPSDELIQQPKKTLLNKSASFESSPLKKKKSLSIQSFTSNIPSKSRSKSRKLSFFNTVKPNIFQTFSKQNKKTDQNLNTTIKKVKKDLLFTKSSSKFHSYLNQDNQKQNCVFKHIKSEDLKQKLQKRLSHTCQSKFFNQNVQQKQLSIQKFQNDYQQPLDSEKLQREIQSSFASKNEKKQLQQSLKQSILKEIDRKEKQNYEHLLKEIENKLSNKFDYLLNGIMKQKQSNERNVGPIDAIKNVTKKTDSHGFQLTPTNCLDNQYIQNSKNINDDKKYLSVKKSQKISPDPVQKVMRKQPSICNMLKQNKQKNQPLYEASRIQEVQPVQIKKESKVNTSVIVQKDSAKIIKSKSRNSPIVKETTQNLIQKKKVQKNHQQSTEKQKNYKNPLDHNDSIDSIQIQDSLLNSTVYTKSKSIEENTFYRQNKKMVTNQKHQIGLNFKQEDNFYMKRIKQLKKKMQNSIKSYKIACDKLILPVNQTFMLIFSTCYQQFCELNFLPLYSQEVMQTISKYKSKAEINSKKPQNDEKFLMDSLLKIQKMVNLKCPPQKKLKIQEYTEKCLECIENIYFEKPELKLNDETKLTKKLKQIKVCLANSNNQ